MKVVVAAAGTGGHINPGIAIANKIKKENPKAEIIFIGTQRGLENDLVPKAGYKLKTIEAYGLSKKISIQNISNIIKTLRGFKQAEKIIDEIKPDLVIGTGGYICGAVLTAAHNKKIPTMLHESNAFPGTAVKMLAKDTDTIMVGFKEAKDFLKKAKRVVVTGTPTKIKNLHLTDEQKKEVKLQMGLKDDKPVVLIFGGSQGAKRINDAIMEIIREKRNRDYQIIWAAGPNQYDGIKQELEKDNININNICGIKIVPYIYNMQEIMNACDLVVARSGAMTITEIAIVQKPAIFIPLPSRSANRQEDNARVLERKGAAKVILNEELNGDVLSKAIDDIVVKQDKASVEQMGKNASTIVIENVEDKIYEEVKRLIGEIEKL
ncbi:MAG: undecaprenyldiphospho-muramoylpentapeptide beta-N-acetylglucosaminyltransferase [Clostridia bacterium]|nr:undecaprenyldiphospho-muramoylpentapeptide beta-N-acetylglucosaminyltransferase [Clostridia bacterium]